MNTKPELSIATWKYDKDWVYSITYDEALFELHRFVVPVHRELCIPGHLEVVAGHMGVVRALGESSFNGLRHMSGEELKELMAEGWGVGNHSWSHGMVMDDPETELKKSKETIEKATGRPCAIFTAPGSNANLTPEVLERLPGYGYLAGMSITDDLNYSDADDLVWLNRVPIHESYGGYFESAFEPYKRIRQAQERHGWIVDYCHCPLEKPLHECKDVTAAHHRERLETIVAEGGAGCWFANPDDVVDYRYMRRHARIERGAQDEGRFRVRLDSLPDAVSRRELTFRIKGLTAPEVLSVEVDGVNSPAAASRAGVLSFTAPVHDVTVIELRPNSPSRNPK